jgi:hypothetical protein
MNFRLVISVVVGTSFAVVVGTLTLLGCNAHASGEIVPGATCYEGAGGWNVVASFILPTFASIALLDLARRRRASQEEPLEARQLAAIGAVSVAMAAASFGGALELTTPYFQSDPAWLGFRELVIDWLSLFILPLFITVAVVGLAVFRHFVRRVPVGWKAAAWKWAVCVFSGAIGFYLSLGIGGGFECQSYGAPFVLYTECRSLFNGQTVSVYYYAYAVNFAFWIAASYLLLALMLGLLRALHLGERPVMVSAKSRVSPT